MGYSTSGAGCCRGLLIIFNVLFLLLGLAVCGGGIYMFVSEIRLREIIGSTLYEAAIFVTFGSGVATIIISIIGLVGAATRNKVLLIIYFVCLLIIFLLMAIGGIIAVVFRSNIQKTMKETMTDTLVKDYGRHEYITAAWDWAQENLKCCAVENERWSTYQKSSWYRDQTTTIINSVSLRYVPKSCCVRDDSGNIVKQTLCQYNSKKGPPNSDAGNKNIYVHYQGCYEAGYNFAVERAWIIFGIGLGVAFCMILGLVVSVCVFRTLG